MKLKSIITAFCFLCAGTIPAHGIELDIGLLPLCLKLADAPNAPSLQKAYRENETIRMMVPGLGARGDVSFEQIADQKERLQSYAKNIESLRLQMPELVAQATAFIGPDALAPDFRIHLVCGAPADGFGFKVDGDLTLFVNLPSVPEDFFPSLIRHELWHIAFRGTYPEIATDYESAQNPLKRLSFIMLNEGVGHYYSFQRRVEPTIQYGNWAERTGAVFSLLHEKQPELARITDFDAQENFMWTAQASVPFWKKWGALPGAVITYRLKEAIGTESLKKVIAGGPCHFLETYQKLASETPEWETIPAPIITAACEVS